MHLHSEWNPLCPIDLYTLIQLKNKISCTVTT